MAEGQGSGSGWLKYCAIGCGIIVLLAIAAGVGIYLLVGSAIKQGATQIQSEANRQYEAKFPEIQGEDLDLTGIEALHGHSQRQDLGSTAIMVSSGLLLGVIDDEEISEQEVAIVATMMELLGEEPDPGWMQIGQWIQDNPELGEYLNEIQEEAQQQSRSMQMEAPVEEETPAPAMEEEEEAVPAP